MKYIKHLIVLLFIFNSTQFFAQAIVAEKGSFGVDTNNKIIVWHQKNLDSLNTLSISDLKFDSNFKINEPTKALSYSEIKGTLNNEEYTLYISRIPLVHITVDTSKINSDYKIAAKFSFYSNKEFVESTIGVRHRGNLSLSFAKKSFDLEFWKDAVSKQSKDVKFRGMRNDDDWILDAMYNEPLHLRSHIAAKLWNKIHKPYYLDKEPKAKSGFEVQFVEVFKNNQYYGIYQFSESVDRKQLKLKKNVGTTIYGELYKADSYKGGPAFTNAPEKYNNLFPHWNGWQIEYPFIDYTSDWDNLFKFTNFVVNSTDQDFVKNIESKVETNNAIDYYLFVNLLKATDNLGKNYYFGKYDTNKPYFFIPWDLDGTLGVIQDGKHEQIPIGVLGNGLFNRLIETNPNNYKNRVKQRWIALRETTFSDEELASRIDKIYNRFTDEKIYQREELVWNSFLNEVPKEEHYKYLKRFLKNRLDFLDEHFNAL